MQLPEFLKQIDSALFQIEKDYRPGMRVPARIVATPKLVGKIETEVFKQLTNLAVLPGVVNYVYALPDAHSGYGAPVGSVFATNPEAGGIISPGAVGYDINCGVRLLTTNLSIDEIRPKLKELVNNLFVKIPTGVGAESNQKLSPVELDELLSEGVSWCKNRGWGKEEDFQNIEEGGRMDQADPGKVSAKAKKRGRTQSGTLGSGNHYLEIQRVTKIFDEKIARELKINKGQITLMIHCGSRGLGHQVASDYLEIFGRKMPKYNISVPDRQLVCLPFTSPEGQDYFKAMSAAVNFAFVNRQMITYWVRKVFSKVFNKNESQLSLNLVYDVCHNIAKKENYTDKEDGQIKELIVHRKGATRSFGPDNPKVPKKYQQIGQPVIVGGSMQTGSYLLVGTKKAEQLTFGSTSHGSGRVMSRTQAKRKIRGHEIQSQMSQSGIYVRATSLSSLAEEAGAAYKDINEVIEAVDRSGISRPVACFEPLGNIKG